MTHETAIKILEIQEEFRNSLEFESLWAEHQLLSRRFNQVMERLSKEDTDSITDFLGIVNEIHLKTLAYSISARK